MYMAHKGTISIPYKNATCWNLPSKGPDPRATDADRMSISADLPQWRKAMSQNLWGYVQIGRLADLFVDNLVSCIPNTATCLMVSSKVQILLTFAKLWRSSTGLPDCLARKHPDRDCKRKEQICHVMRWSVQWVGKSQFKQAWQE